MSTRPIPAVVEIRSREERWDAIEMLIADWFREPRSATPVRLEDIETALKQVGFQIPAAVQEWHLRFGHLNGVWSAQDRLLRLSELSVRGGLMTIVDEAQSVFQWGVRETDLALSDPPVYVLGLGGPGERMMLVCEAETVTEFAARFVLRNAKFSWESLGGNGVLGVKDWAAKLAGGFRRVEAGTGSGPGDPTTFFERSDVLIEINAGNDWIWLTANTVDAYRGAATDLRNLKVDWQHEDL